MTSPLPKLNLALLNKPQCKHTYQLSLSLRQYTPIYNSDIKRQEKHTQTYTHTEPAGPRPRAEQTVHFMNINTKCTGPPAVHNTKAICKGKDQKHSYCRVPDYTQHVSSSTSNEATPHYLPSIPPPHPPEPPTHSQSEILPLCHQKSR